MGVLLMLARFRPTQHARNYSRIVTLLRDKPTQHQVKVNGWVKAIRKQKERTFIDLDDGSCVKKLQVVVPSALRPPGVSYHAAVSVEGMLQSSAHPAQEVELLAGKVEVVSGVGGDEYPFKPRQTHPPDYTRAFPHLRTRTTSFAAMMRVRSQAKLSIQEYFASQGFTCIDTPVLTTNDCEGGGEAFTVQANQGKTSKENNNNNYFGRPTHLTVSGQLHLEAAASCLSKVFTFNPAFRAENSQTRRHLAEFWMVEGEEAFMGGEGGLWGVEERVEGLVKECLKEVVEKRQEDVGLYWKDCEGREAIIRHTLDEPFLRLTHQEAVDTLTRHAPRLSIPPPQPGHDLRREHEVFLTSHAGHRPVFVTHWPREIKAFYMATLEGQPDVALALDLLLPEVGEAAGGGVREPSPATLLHTLPPDTQQGLAWYLEMRGMGGAPPTAGFGLGFERLLQFLLGVKNIKDVVAFPRWAGHCVC